MWLAVASRVTVALVIKSFVHGRLKRFFETDSMKNIPQDMAKRLRVRIDALDAANDVSEMNVPGWDLHELKGNRKGTWSLKVTANYRLTFKFVTGEALDVDLEDYH